MIALSLQNQFVVRYVIYVFETDWHLGKLEYFNTKTQEYLVSLRMIALTIWKKMTLMVTK